MKNRNKDFHGIISIMLYLISLVTGIVAVAGYSLIYGLLYLVFIIIAFWVVARVYCSKCRCRERCNHYFIGKLSVFLTKANFEPYKPFDWIAGLFPMTIAIVFPQYWLLQMPLLFALYWFCIVIAAAEVWFWVCTRCHNSKCRMCRNKVIVLKNEYD